MTYECINAYFYDHALKRLLTGKCPPALKISIAVLIEELGPNLGLFIDIFWTYVSSGSLFITLECIVYCIIYILHADELQDWCLNVKNRFQKVNIDVSELLISIFISVNNTPLMVHLIFCLFSCKNVSQKMVAYFITNTKNSIYFFLRERKSSEGGGLSPMSSELVGFYDPKTASVGRYGNENYRKISPDIESCWDFEPLWVLCCRVGLLMLTSLYISPSWQSQAEKGIQ